MDVKRVRCPDCSALLEIPKAFKGTKIRCSACETNFRIPAISDTDILGWIARDSKEDSATGVSSVDIEIDETQEEVAPVAALPAEEEESSTAEYSKEGEDFRLVRVGQRGPVFEFPVDMLNDPGFRGAIPRHCLRCGAVRHLRPHLVIFAHQMTDCSSLESDFLDSTPSLGETEVCSLSVEEILGRLPKLKKMPSPTDLPMPYWICDMCSPANMIFAQGSEDRCRIQISRLWRAEEFLVNVRGEGAPAFEELHRQLEKNPQTLWDTLPGVVQQRIRQWFKPIKKEKYIAYIPDRTRSRTEDGMVGVVVSTRRLIYNSSMRHYENEKGSPLELDFAMESGRLGLHIKGAGWEIKNMIVDKPDLENLRRSLTGEKFPAVWR